MGPPLAVSAAALLDTDALRGAHQRHDATAGLVVDEDTLRSARWSPWDEDWGSFGLRLAAVIGKRRQRDTLTVDTIVGLVRHEHGMA
jgi:hypothetical protein